MIMQTNREELKNKTKLMKEKYTQTRIVKNHVQNK